MSETVSNQAPLGHSWLDERRTESMIWWLAVAGAATSVVLGIMVLAWPEATLLVGAAVFGIWLLVHGIIRIINAVTATSADPASRTLAGVIGVLFVLAGVFCVRNILLSLVAVATVIGASWIIGGIAELVTAFGNQYDGRMRLVAAALGIILLLGGLVILIWPGPSLATLVYLTGIWLIVTGAIQLALVIGTRPHHA